MVGNMYEQAIAHVERDLDVVYMLKTIQKLKAGLSTLMLDNHELIQKAKSKYLQDCTLQFDEEGNAISKQNSTLSFGRMLTGESIRSAKKLKLTP